MPITLPPLSRRRFLAGVTAATVAAFAPNLRADDATSDHVALLSDIHIAADPAAINRETCMARNLQQAVAEVLALKDRPTFALISGDLALQAGQAGDYATFLELVKPVRQAGLPLHLLMGNHDNRERFWDALGEAEAAKGQAAVKDRQITVATGRFANWFMLDSLMETAKTPGVLGEAQLAWLGDALDQHPDKPAIVVVHHNPAEEGHAVPGLTDSPALFDVLRKRKHVKAYLFGHTHDWLIGHESNIHLVNLPPVAYVFAPGKPNGWVDAYVDAKGMRLELRTIDPKHPNSGQKVELAWV